jgi:ComF family protein
MLGRAVGGSIQIAAGDCQPMRHPRVDRLFDELAGLLLPANCVLCGETGPVRGLDLCRDCLLSLPRDPGPLRAGPAPIDRCFAPFMYAFPADSLVHRLKYRGQLAVGRVLGILLAAAVRDFALHRDVDGLVPIPLHPTRHAERGFNQSAEIGARAAGDLDCRYLAGAVRRVRATRPQVGLHPEERRSNLEGAFRASVEVRGRRVAVVDDVLTTGATAGAVAAALREAGAHSVDVWCIARAPAPERLDWRSRPEASSA